MTQFIRGWLLLKRDQYRESIESIIPVTFKIQGKVNSVIEVYADKKAYDVSRMSGR